MLSQNLAESGAGRRTRPAPINYPECSESISAAKLPIVNKGITLTEVPNQIAVFFEIGNCTIHCEDCHSPELWDTNYTKDMETYQDIKNYIEKQYKLGANAVLFMGGLRSSGIDSEVFIQDILKPLYYDGYDICLYDGGKEDYTVIKAAQYCKWIKIGPYIKALGGLDNPNTNQRFYQLEEDMWIDKTKEYFQKEN